MRQPRVTQDYVKANQYFQTGADAKVAACQYMLGVCYIKGYGVAQDSTIGKQFITKAANKGYDKAIDFVKNGRLNEEISLPVMRSASTAGIDSLIPSNLTTKYRQQRDKLGKNKINGLWSGRLITYDWSGKNIEKQESLKLYLSSDGTSLSGSWTQADTINIRIEGSLNDSVWTFSNSKYEKKNTRSWQINNGSFELVKDRNTTYLKGSVTKYNLTTKEPSRPAYIVLQQATNREAQTSDSINETLSSSVSAYPNPFSNQLNIKLALTQEQTGILEIYDQSGRKVYSSGNLYFSQGVTVHPLTLNLLQGAYTLQFNSKDVHLNTLIVKK